MPVYDAWELDQLLKQAGFADGLARRTAWSVAMRESRGDSDVVNKTNANGSWDYGLFQINNHAHKDTVNWDKIFNAVYQAKLVFKWTNGGTDWSAWGLGNDKGWAKHLYNTNRKVWQQIQDDFLDQYERYPAMVFDADPNTGVYLPSVSLGGNSGSVKKYQIALHKYLTKKQVKKFCPSGPTGYYGSETAAGTKRAYKRMVRKTGNAAWKTGSPGAPRREFVEALGLKVRDKKTSL